MRRFPTRVACLALALCCSAPALAAGNITEQKLTDCITLSDNHTAARAGGNALVVRDGEANYRLDFGSQCSATALSSRVVIATGKQANVVCPSGSTVSARHHQCAIRSALLISPQAYDRHARRR